MTFLTGTGRHRVQIIYFFRIQIGSRTLSGIGLGSGSRLRRMRRCLGLSRELWIQNLGGSWYSSRHVPRGAVPGGLPNTISGGGGPSGGQRVGLRLVESSTTGPQRLPLPCRSPPVVRARRHLRCRNSLKECRRRACPCKSSTGLEEYPPRARFLRLRRSIGR